MKLILKCVLKYYLKLIVKIALFINKPKVIAIAGSANKYFTKIQIQNILSDHNIKSKTTFNTFNTEIGLPLSILNLESGYSSYKKWAPIMLKAFTSIFKNECSGFLVLEFGVSAPGDAKYLLSVVKPDILIVTNVTQRYIESFRDVDCIITEYRCLVNKMKKDNLILLNSDNELISSLAKHTSANVVKFGINNESDWQIMNIENRNFKQVFDIKNNHTVNSYSIDKQGTHHVYAYTIGQIILNYVEKKYIKTNQ